MPGFESGVARARSVPNLPVLMLICLLLGLEVGCILPGETR
jgi:hypothetical protein